MIARYRLLARRILLELDDLERTQAAIQKHWQTARKIATDQDAYLNSVALNLHSFYIASATFTPRIWTPTGWRPWWPDFQPCGRRFGRSWLRLPRF